MKTIEQELLDFKKFTSEQRYKLVLSMLEVLKAGNENRTYVYNTMQDLNPPSDGLLESIYQEILKLAEKKKQNTKELEMQSFHKIKSRIQEIQLLETEEQNNNNPDEILNQI